MQIFKIHTTSVGTVMFCKLHNVHNGTSTLYNCYIPFACIHPFSLNQNDLADSLSLSQDVWYGRGPGWWRFRWGGERGGVLDRGRGEDAAPSHGPQRGQCMGQPQGQVRLCGLWDGSHLLEPVCRLSQRSAPGSGLLCGAAACDAAAVCRFPLSFQGELSAAPCGLKPRNIDLSLILSVAMTSCGKRFTVALVDIWCASSSRNHNVPQNVVFDKDVGYDNDNRFLSSKLIHFCHKVWSQTFVNFVCFIL